MDPTTKKPIFTNMADLRKYAASLPSYSGNITPVKTMEELKKRSYESSTFNEFINGIINNGPVTINDNIITNANTTVSK